MDENAETTEDAQMEPGSLHADYYLPIDATQEQVDEAWSWAEDTVERMALERRKHIDGMARQRVELATYTDQWGDSWYREPQEGDVVTTQRLRVIATVS